MNDALPMLHKDRLSRSPEHQKGLWGVSDVEDVLVLVCGHGGRDARCGIFGPLLQGEFEAKLGMEDIEVLRKPVVVDVDAARIAVEGNRGSGPGKMKMSARVGLISHIGGHKFAGNVIIYIPPAAMTRDGGKHELAGCGIWYGRVEPKHVEGIVRETVLNGRVIMDLFRGGIDQDGEILRL